LPDTYTDGLVFPVLEEKYFEYLSSLFDMVTGSEWKLKKEDLSKEDLIQFWQMLKKWSESSAVNENSQHALSPVFGHTMPTQSATPKEFLLKVEKLCSESMKFNQADIVVEDNFTQP